MTNWVYNSMTVEASNKEDMDRFLEDITGCYNGKPSPLCFNRIVPMPAVLVVKAAQEAEMAYHAFYGNFTKAHQPAKRRAPPTTREGAIRLVKMLFPANAKAMADRARRNMDQHGACDWRNWRLARWGVQWDAASGEVYRPSDTVAEFHFETAHFVPKGIIRALVALYPELTFCGAFTEQMGEFEGEFDGADIRVTKPAREIAA